MILIISIILIIIIFQKHHYHYPHYEHHHYKYQHQHHLVFHSEPKQAKTEYGREDQGAKNHLVGRVFLMRMPRGENSWQCDRVLLALMTVLAALMMLTGKG